MIPRQKGTGKIDYRFHRWENRPWKNRLQDFTFGKSTVEKSTTGFYLWKSTVEKSTTGFTGGKIDRGKIDYRILPLENRLQVSPVGKSTVEKSTTGFTGGKIDYRFRAWAVCGAKGVYIIARLSLSFPKTRKRHARWSKVSPSVRRSNRSTQWKKSAMQCTAREGGGTWSTIRTTLLQIVMLLMKLS